MSPPEEEIDGNPPPPPPVCDVNGPQTWCSYCKQGICYQILSVTYFNTFYPNTFAHLKNGWSDTQRCYVASSFTHLGVNTRK